MTNFFKYIPLFIVIVIIIAINYELLHYEKKHEEVKENYSKQLADLIIKNVMAIPNVGIPDKTRILKVIINKFMLLNVVTKNTKSGQSLVFYLHSHLQEIGQNNADIILSEQKIASYANEIIDSLHVLIEIIYPVLISVI